MSIKSKTLVIHGTADDSVEVALAHDDTLPLVSCTAICLVLAPVAATRFVIPEGTGERLTVFDVDDTIPSTQEDACTMRNDSEPGTVLPFHADLAENVGVALPLTIDRLPLRYPAAR